MSLFYSRGKVLLLVSLLSMAAWAQDDAQPGVQGLNQETELVGELPSSEQPAAAPLPPQITIGQRLSLQSEILDQQRHYQIYLPPSYGSRPDFTYPVIYMVDGDYNFHPMTGVIELLSGIASYAPEMIFVGISDKGAASYRHNMQPKLSRKKGGQADKFLRFVNEELKPHIESNYRTADYSILVGQSMGGLFVVNTLLEQPESFNAYIAISPMMWWQDHKLDEKAKKAIAKSKAPAKKLYLSLADENRMGVYGLVELLDRGRPDGIDWQFKKYDQESHNSVGLITVSEALKDLYSGWYQSFAQLQKFEDFSAVRNHYQKLMDRFGLKQEIPEFTFKALMYQYKADKKEQQSAALYLQTRQFLPQSVAAMNTHLAALEIKAKRFEKAKQLLDEVALENPELAKLKEAYGDLYLAQDKAEQAEEAYQQALAQAKQQGMRQWYLNALAGKLLALQ